MSRSKGLVAILIPSATVFISSGCIMILELVAGRLIARHLGSSLYTWTSVIGVVLAGITIGNYIGGRIADRFRARKALAVLFGVSSAACVGIVVLNNVVGEWIWLWQLSWPVRVFSHVALVFLLPSTLLGMISPVVAKMALDLGFATGRTVGDIYAWGAAGSIAGTFLAGFYLIAAVGTIAIIWLVGGILLVMGILYWARLWALYVWGLIFIALAIMAHSGIAWAQETGASIGVRAEPDPDIVYEDETQYCYVAVRRVSQSPEKLAFMQDKLMHSQMETGNIRNLLYSYAKIHAAVTHLNSEGKQTLNTLTIGGGGYVFPRYIEEEWPGSQIDVVEIDPGVTEAAMRGFGLSSNTEIRTISMDARNYVDQLIEEKRRTGSTKRYDFIYEDAINDYSVPFQLVTREFNEKIFAILDDDGAYMVSVIDIFKKGRFLGAVSRTIRQTFPHVYIIAQRYPQSMRNIFSIIATKRKLNLKDIGQQQQVADMSLWVLNESEMKSLWDKAGTVLTDDYAPVENLLAPVVRASSVGLLAEKYIDDAKKFKRDGNLGEAIAKFGDAIRADPTLSVYAYNEMGLLFVAQGKLEQAVESFESALAYNEQSEDQEDLPNVHFNIGIAYGRMGKKEESIKYLQSAISGFQKELQKKPDSLKIVSMLGNAYAETGRFKEAVDCFKQAVNLNPYDVNNHTTLAQALVITKRYDEALLWLRNAAEFFSSHVGDTETAAKLKEYADFIEFTKVKEQHSGSP